MTAKHLEPGQTYSTALSKGWFHQQVWALEKFLFLAWLLAREIYSRTIQLLSYDGPGKPVPWINAHQHPAAWGLVHTCYLSSIHAPAPPALRDLQSLPLDQTSAKGVSAQVLPPKLKHPALPSLLCCLQGRDENRSQWGQCTKSQHLDLSGTLWRAAFTPRQSKSSSCTLPTVCALPSPQEVCCTKLSKFALVCILHVFLGWRGRGRSGGSSTQYWNYCTQIQIFHVAHLGRNMPCKANSQKGSLKKTNRWFYTRTNQQHFSSFTLAAAISHLLFCQSLLDFLVITDVINNRLGKLRLNPGQPGAKVTHVFVQ